MYINPASAVATAALYNQNTAAWYMWVFIYPL
jgi:hypothetical protein